MNGGCCASEVLFTGEPEFDVRPEPVVIAEIDGWRMDDANSMLIPWLYNTCAVLSHKCPKTKWRQWMAVDDTMYHKICPCCGEDIPESVLTVWHLYNADDIAKYNKQLHDTQLNEYPLEEDWEGSIYEDSSPLTAPLLDGPYLYDLKGELLELSDEVSEWNGTDPEGNVWLYNADNKLERV
jgi:hypothetical protein